MKRPGISISGLLQSPGLPASPGSRCELLPLSLMVITSNKQDKWEVISPAGRSEGDGWKAPWRLRNEMVSIHGGSVSKARLQPVLENSRGEGPWEEGLLLVSAIPDVHSYSRAIRGDHCQWGSKPEHRTI